MDHFLPVIHVAVFIRNKANGAITNTDPKRGTRFKIFYLILELTRI
jgi:hypothetical protein